MSLQFKDKFDTKSICSCNLIVAFSGGKDSTALLHFIVSNGLARRVVAVHINHGLRDRATIDEHFCAEFCKRYNIEFIASKIGLSDSDKRRDGIEKTARDGRYRRLSEIKDRLESDSGKNFKIVTAHTLDDNIETFFINLLRSTSIYTLKGISSNRNDIIRPMLKISSDEVLKYLESVNEAYTFDDSNDDDRYLRNNIRLNLIPALREFDFNTLVKNIIKLQEQSSNIDELFSDIVKSAIINEDSKMTMIDKAKFESLDKEYKRYLLGKVFSKSFKVTDNILDDALALANNSESRRIDLPDGYKFETSFGVITFFHDTLLMKDKVVKECAKDSIEVMGKVIVFSNQLIDKRLTVSTRTDGDKVDGKKLKDMLIDRKIRLFDRDRAIIIRDEEDRIIFAEWVYPNTSIKLWSIR